MIELRNDPSPREVRLFGLLWLLFCVGVGLVLLWRPEGLVGAAGFLSVAWVVSLLFNPAPRRDQALGFLMPALFGLAGGTVEAALLGPRDAALAATAAGAAGALLIWVVPSLGRRVWVGWMLAAFPIGWTISHAVLAAVYYLVLTPIGLLMRLVGRDPMRRRLDPRAETYWIEREGRRDSTSYFRQF